MHIGVRTSPTDEELVRAARGGSPEALTELYRRHAGLVYRSAFRLLLDPADAEDVLQDVFVGLPEALRRFDSARPLEPWLRRVAARVTLSRLRAERRRLRREGEAAGAHEPRTTAAWPSPLDRLALRHAFDRLPSPLRAVLLLKEVEGYSHEEIGDILGITPGTSATRLHRAWSRLRHELGS